LWGKFCGTGLYSFGGGILWNCTVYVWVWQIGWNWTLKVWGRGKFCGNGMYKYGGANCVELDCIGFGEGKLCGSVLYWFGGGQIVWKNTVQFWGWGKVCGTGL
jgi:hypothetical protein